MSQRPIDYSTWNNSELIDLVELPDEHHGLRYYLSKAQKVAMLDGSATSKDVAAYLTEARRKQEEHHLNLRTRRAAGPIDKGASIEAKLGDEVWRYVESRRVPAGFRDAATNRKATVAFIIQGVRSGSQLWVTRGTVDHAHAHLRKVDNWPPPRGRRPSREAAVAGVVTAAMLKR